MLTWKPLDRGLVFEVKPVAQTPTHCAYTSKEDALQQGKTMRSVGFEEVKVVSSTGYLYNVHKGILSHHLPMLELQLSETALEPEQVQELLQRLPLCLGFLSYHTCMNVIVFSSVHHAHKAFDLYKGVLDLQGELISLQKLREEIEYDL